MFGLGGVFVEALRDVTFRMAPLGALDAHDLIHGIRGLPLLQGVRGSSPVDFAALTDAVLRVSRLAVDLPEIVELDVNPLLALPDRVVAVDARIMVD
jgi:acetyltransferase